MRTPRNQQRGNLASEVRLLLLENDADGQEDAIAALRGTLNWILGLLFAVLISTTTGTVMLLITGIVK